MQTALAYQIGAEFEANHCEFYIDSFGVGSFRYLETKQKFLDIYLRVNERELVRLQGDEILSAGAALSLRSFTAQIDDDRRPFIDLLEFTERVTAERVASESWQLRFAFEEQGSPLQFFKEIRGLAFFIDIKRNATGRIERLWVRNLGHDFTIDGIFEDRPGTEMSIGIGAIRYPEASSPIYYQKKACAAL